MATKGSPLALLLLLVLGYASCDSLYGQTPYGNSFDAWRNSFLQPISPLIPQDGTRQLWPNIPNYPLPDSSFDDDAETVEFRTEGPQVNHHDPFDIETIITDVPHQNTDSGVLFQQSFPFLENNPIFTTFGGFGFGQRKEPWWKGANVCTMKEEDDEEESAEKDNEDNTGLGAAGLQSQLFSGFHFSIDSCVDKQNKHICKKIFSQNGKKKTLVVTRECCYGYGRPRNADVTTPCEKIDIKSIPETAEEMGTKEFVRSVKNNGLDEKLNTNVTIFMPTDSAFTEFSEQMFENNLVVLPLRRGGSRSRRAAAADQSGITTKDLILNHMVDGWVNMDDISNEELLTTNYDNATIRINVFPKPPNSRDQESRFRYTANCAPILKMNKLTTNGMVHAVDRVLTPVTMSVMDVIRQRDDMTVLRTILERTKMQEMLEGKKPVTILAPTDKAFAKLDTHLRRTLKEGKGCASNILKNHILDLTFCSVAVANDARTSAYNIMGEQLVFTRSARQTKESETTEAAEVSDLVGIQDVLINGKVRIVESDLMGTNGVVHVIDTIMPTESALPITSLMEKKNLTIFKRLVEASELENEFDDMQNVTFFAPTDKAFDGSVWKKMLDENPSGLKGSAELKELLKYHVVEPMTRTCDLTEKVVPSASGKDLRINLYSTHAVFSDVMNRATVNCARLMHFDDESCGSVLHQVDKVLTPPQKSLFEQLEANPNYSKFLDMVKSANLTDLLNDKEQSFTLLVPKDDVFQEFDLEKSEMENLVKTHIVNDVVCCAGIIPTNWPFVRTIETINNHRLRIGRDRRPKVENSGITKCDIIATNGIVHEINDVIVPRRSASPNRPQRPPTTHSFDDMFF